ncbi:MAG: HAMP domain-containing sensor histidine kinase [Actinomycetota bacterium]|nr:HAMP domain-containing sensor histidine kinase [Actinomycetota bacterium]
MAENGKLVFRSLRSRFLFYFLILSLLSLLLFGTLFTYFVWRLRSQEQNKARSELVDQAQDMANDLELVIILSQQIEGFTFATTERVAQLLRLEGKLINATSAVVDSKGQIVAPQPVLLRFPRQLDTKLLAETETVEQEADLGRLGEVYVVAVPLNVQDSNFYNLVVAKRIEELSVTPSGELMRYLVIAGAAALILSIILALYLSSYVLKPLRRLSHAAWDLARGNLDSRVEVRGKDEISELSEYFNYMAGRIQQSTELQKNFVANVSHEIRTPLTSIEGFSQALLEGMVEKEESRRRYLSIINEESRRLKRVLVQLLALSRLDAGSWVLHPSSLDLSEFLEDMEQKFLPHAMDKGIELRVRPPAEETAITTDRDALEQILTNLLDNALKFSPEGEAVVLECDHLPGGGARIQVRDSGQGIPAEELDQIFDRFVRVERSRSKQYGGSGLGLAVCRELLNLLGGRMAVWSKPGKGSVFTVELPPQPPDIPPGSIDRGPS